MNNLQVSVAQEFKLDKQSLTQITEFSDQVLKKAETETRKRTDLKSPAAYFMTIARKEHIKRLTESASGGNKQLEKGELRSDQIMPPDGKPLFIANWNIAKLAKERTVEELKIQIDQKTIHLELAKATLNRSQDSISQRIVWQIEAQLLNWKKALALAGETHYEVKLFNIRKETYTPQEIAVELYTLSNAPELPDAIKYLGESSEIYKKKCMANIAFNATLPFEEPEQPDFEQQVALGYIQEWRDKLIDCAPTFYKKFKFASKFEAKAEEQYNPQEIKKDSPQLKFDTIPSEIYVDDTSQFDEIF